MDNVLATSIALVLSLCFAPAALAANDNCPTRWDSSCGASSFYYGEIQQEISGAVGLCVDVSKWQGSSDWAAVKAAGIDYAIIRCGFGQDEPGPAGHRLLSDGHRRRAAGAGL